MARKKSQDIRNQVLEIFRAHGGIMRTSEVIALGIHSRVLYELRDSGQLDCLMKGVYALSGLPGIDQPDFATIAKKMPSGIICLVSALYFHELTVQIPRWVDVALLQGYHPPTITYPPVQFHWYSDAVFKSGVETHDMGGIKVKIYSPEKSIVDCFRLRRKVGVDVAVEALKNYWKKGKINLNLLRNLAKESRMLRIMTPYIETVIHDQS